MNDGNLAFLAAALQGRDAAAPDDLLTFARRHSCRQILGWLLDGSSLRGRLQPEVLLVLDQGRREQAERSARLLAALDRVAAAFRAAGLDFLLLKGLGLCARYYGGLDRRATMDLDLLVREADVAAAGRALEGVGFRRASIVPSRRLALRVTHAFDYVGDSLTVDLHWTLARHPSFRFDVEGLRGRREADAVGGVPIDRPCDEDALAFCALGAFRDLQRGSLRARALVDLYRIALRCERVDWGAFLERRRAEGTYGITVNMLALLLHALDARAALPAVARVVDAAGDAVHVCPGGWPALLARQRFALRNRIFALGLYRGSAARSVAWWLATWPVRVLTYRSWRRRGSRR